MYGSRVGVQTGFDIYEGQYLENRSNPKSIFEITNDFWATTDAWAPEVHYNNNSFYMFTSFKADGVCRGTQILISDSPNGQFTPLTKSRLSQSTENVLTELFYIDNHGNPQIVFCRE